MTDEQVLKNRLYYKKYFSDEKNRQRKNDLARERYRRIRGYPQIRPYKKWCDKNTKREGKGHYYYGVNSKRIKEHASKYYYKNRKLILAKSKLNRELRKNGGLPETIIADKIKRREYFRKYYKDNPDKFNLRKPDPPVERTIVENRSVFLSFN